MWWCFHCPHGETCSPVVLLDNTCLSFPLVDIYIYISWYILIYFLLLGVGFSKVPDPFLLVLHWMLSISLALHGLNHKLCVFASFSSLVLCLKLRFSLPINPPLWKLDNVCHQQCHLLAPSRPSSTLTVTAQNEWCHSWPGAHCWVCLLERCCA